MNCFWRSCCLCWMPFDYWQLLLLLFVETFSFLAGDELLFCWRLCSNSKLNKWTWKQSTNVA
jgi:hypothetical protein